MQESISFTVQTFEGPLDLLMHLIEQNKIDIRDIPIALLLEQYLTAVSAMQHIDLDVQSEFLLLASRLLYIKSRALLPVEEEEEDPREELVVMLETYMQYKALAGALSEQYDVYGRVSYTKSREQIEVAKKELEPISISRLIEAYGSVFRNSLRKRPPPIESFTQIVASQTASVTSTVFSVIRRLVENRSVRMLDLLLMQNCRADIVTHFIAVLELSRQRRIELKGEAEELRILLRQREYAS